MEFLPAAYYFACYGLAVSGLASSFAPRKGRGGWDAPRAGFRGLLMSACVGTVGLSFGYFQSRSAGLPLLTGILNLTTLLSIPGCVAFIPRFTAPFRPGRPAVKAVRGFSALAIASTPIAVALALNAKYRLPSFLTIAASILLIASLAAAIGYGTWQAVQTLRHAAESERAVGKSWMSVLRWMLASAIAVGPLTILDDFLLLPQSRGWTELPGALPLLAAAWGLVFLVSGAGRPAPGGAGRPGGAYEWPDAALTPRETEVARLLVTGYSYRMIADKLGISQTTVKSHVLNAYGKTGAGNKIELLSFAQPEAPR
jgi:DNA-binding CsgD family transcriptional regulator